MHPSDDRVLAPFVPSSDALCAAALEAVSANRSDTVLDLGSGTGNLLVAAVSAFAVARVIGYELDAGRRITTLNRLDRLTPCRQFTFAIRGEDANLARPEDLREATIVFVYLLTVSNERLRPMLEAYLRPGSRVISHDFPFVQWQEDKCLDFDKDLYQHRIWVYTMGPALLKHSVNHI
jgi:SAM-dependent methyltransferase